MAAIKRKNMAVNKKTTTKRASGNTRLQKTSFSKSNRRSGYDFRRLFRFSAVVIFVVLFAILGVHFLHIGHADAPPEIKSDLAGSYCMSLNNNVHASYTNIETQSCDGRNSENFYLQDQFADPSIGPDTVFIHVDSTWCVHPANSATTDGTGIEIVRCDPNNLSLQWHRFQPDDTYAEFRNVRASNAQGHPMCLTVPSGNTGGVQLVINPCHRFIDQLWKVKNFQAPEQNCNGANPVTAGPSEARCLDMGVLNDVWGYTGSTLHTQFNCIDNIYIRESGWSRLAYNSGSGATGIPQALPYSKMPQAAWLPFQGGQGSAIAQLRWGANYIKNAANYGSPCAAWAWWQNHGWYGPMVPAGGDGTMSAPLYPNGLE